MTTYGCERIKTLGDAYLAVCGMPSPDPSHAIRVIQPALAIRENVALRNRYHTLKWAVRTVVHGCSVVGGIVGTTHYLYDVFGDRITFRLEEHSAPMQVNISKVTRRVVDARLM